MTYATQVDKSHYSGLAYRSSERWNSYYHQLELVRALSPAALLEVGVGQGVVAYKKYADDPGHRFFVFTK